MPTLPKDIFATPSFQSVLSPLASLTVTHLLIGFFCLFFIEFSLFIPQLSKAEPYAPFVVHVCLTVLFTIAAFFIAESYTFPTLLFVGLLYIFVFYRIFALFVLDTHKSQMTVSSLFYQQNATILSPLAIDFIEQQRLQNEHLLEHSPHLLPSTPIALGTVSQTPPKIPVLFVFAHPDDESMFFTPLLHLMAQHNHDVKKRFGLTPPPSLKKGGSKAQSSPLENDSVPPKAGDSRPRQDHQPTPTDPQDLPLPRFAGVTPALYDIHMLCLTNGDFGGLGKIREAELIKTCVDAHQIPAENIRVINEPKLLPDSMTEHWSSAIVQRFVAEYIHEKGLINIDLVPKVAVQDRSEGGSLNKVPSIHHLNFHDLIVLTFDPHGVSGHANHKACYRGVTDYVKSYNTKLLLEEGTLQNQLEGVQNVAPHQPHPQPAHLSDESSDCDVNEDDAMLQRRHHPRSAAPTQSKPIKPAHQVIRLQKSIQHRYISVYGIETIPLWAKYLGPYSATLLIAAQYGTDAPAATAQQSAGAGSIIASGLSVLANGPKPLPETQATTHHPERDSKLVVPNLSSYQSWLSMAYHHSQWVWFRKLFVLFSTYTYITPLLLIEASPLHPSNRHLARSIRDLVMDQPE